MKAILTILLVFTINFTASANEKDSFVANSLVPHDMKIFDLGTTALEFRLQMIKRAQKNIDLEYFIYSIDKSTRLFTQALIEKANQGVKIRMLLDAFLIKGEIDSFYVHELRKAGIEVKYYNTAPTIRFLKVQYRNHRKMLAIDGEEAITGGRNIADEYFDLREDFNFVDQDVWVRGPLVKKMVSSFDLVWDHKLSDEDIERPNKPAMKNRRYRSGGFGWHDSRRRRSLRTKKFQKDLKKWGTHVKKAEDFLVANQEDIEFREELANFTEDLMAKEVEGICNETSYASDPAGYGRKYRKKQRYVREEVLKWIGETEKHLYIDSPYFIADKLHRRALKKLLKDEKQITFLTNSLFSTDALYVNAVFNSHFKRWFKRGMNIYSFDGRIPNNYPVIDEAVTKSRFGTHVKSMIFDGDTFMIGTYNLDPHSSSYNAEMVIRCKGSKELTDAVKARFLSKTEVSTYLSSKKIARKSRFKGIGFGKRMLYYFIKLPSLIFQGFL